MDLYKRMFVLISLADFWTKFCAAALKYSEGFQQSKQKLPVILMHKQALAEDGAFNYAFAGDNGIKQGETIHPDGTRAGAYSYVDPDGQTVSVKYTAGRDGFQILQGDHVPRSPIDSTRHYLSAAASSDRHSLPVLAFGSDSMPIPVPMPNTAASSAGSTDESDDFGFGPTGSYSHYRSKINPTNSKSLYRVHEENSAENAPRIVPHSRIRQDSLEDGRGSGPHSFGPGYSFEFGHSR